MYTDLEELKIEILSRGVFVTEGAELILEGKGRDPLTVGDYATTSGIPLVLGEGIYVNAPFSESFCQSSDIWLQSNGDTLVIRWNGVLIEVKAYAVPDYFQEYNSEGVPYTYFVATHTDRARLSPIAGCAFNCQFCDSPQSWKYRKKSLRDLVDALWLAVNDTRLPAKHVLISGGTPLPEDREYLSSAIQVICKESPIPVGVMMAPTDKIDYPLALLEWGASELSINLELYSEDSRSNLIPKKNEIGLQGYLRFIRRAVEAFGSGKIRSALLVGIEPVEETLNGVRALAEIGCDPMLSPFRPSPVTELKHHPPPSVDMMKRVYEAALRITEASGVKLAPRCIPCQHNTLTFPRGEGYFYH